MIAYLAQPIDRDSSKMAAHLADGLRSALIDRGLAVYQPRAAWGVKGEIPAGLQLANEDVLRRASVLVVALLDDSRTLGVPFEMALAREWQIPIVVVSDIDPASSAVLSALRAPVFHPWYVEQAAQRAAQVAVVPSAQPARWQPMPAGVAPRLGKPGDAGLDLTYSGAVPLTIEPGGMANVEAGIGVQLPPGFWCLIVGRSSTFQRRMFVAPSVIDAGYRGPLYACVWNIGGESQTIEPGDRVAQIVPFELVADRFDWVEAELEQSVRGATGFGSTGR